MSDKNQPSIGVRVVGGKGAWHFFEFVVACVGIAKGAPDAEVVSLELRGVYDNVVCGTGKTWGTVTRVVADPKYAALLTGQKFAVHFLATVGTFFWHTWSKPPVPDFKEFLDPITKPSDSGFHSKVKQEKEWQPAGVVQLEVPNQSSSKPPRFLPPPDECVKGFTVSGVVYIDV